MIYSIKFWIKFRLFLSDIKFLNCLCCSPHGFTKSTNFSILFFFFYRISKLDDNAVWYIRRSNSRCNSLDRPWIQVLWNLDCRHSSLYCRIAVHERLWWTKIQQKIKPLRSILIHFDPFRSYLIQKHKIGNFITDFTLFVGKLSTMAFPVVEFSREGYKIRKVFG